MGYKRYNTITAWELRKMHWKKCRLETNTWLLIEDWIISLDNSWRVLVSHNNKIADWKIPNESFWKEYGWCVYGGYMRDEQGDNTTYKRIEIEEDKNTECEFREWDLVCVSDISEQAAKDGNSKRIFVYKLPWNAKSPFICVNIWSEEKYILWKSYDISARSFAVPAPKEEPKKRRRTKKLTDWQRGKVKKFINSL